MEVLTKILQQGTEFDTLAETVLADRFERLVELVTMMGDQGELPIAMALANVVPCSQWVRDINNFVSPSVSTKLEELNRANISLKNIHEKVLKQTFIFIFFSYSKARFRC